MLGNDIASENHGGQAKYWKKWENMDKYRDFCLSDCLSEWASDGKWYPVHFLSNSGIIAIWLYGSRVECDFSYDCRVFFVLFHSFETGRDEIMNRSAKM